MNIIYNTPWNSDKNIGASYNRMMNLVSDDNQFICYTDADAMFMTNDFGKQLDEIVAINPDCGAFCAMTNRVGSLWQIQPDIDHDTNDIAYHRNVGKAVREIHGTRTENVTNKGKGEVFSGVVILLRKREWRQVQGFKEDGMLGIDSDLHWRFQAHQIKFLLMKGVYVYHWYRGGTGDKSHLLK